MKRICFASLAVAALLAAGCNKSNYNANGTVGTAGRAENEAPSGDKDFVRDVSRMNAAEIDMSRLAVERASSPDVKKFAQMMVDEHTATGDKLSGVAIQNSLEAPTDIDDAHRALHDKLAAKQGLDFDKDYIDAIVGDHEKVVDKLRSRIDKATLSNSTAEATDQVTDQKAEIKVKVESVLPEKSDNVVTQRVNLWAAETYPAVWAHLKSAKALRDGLKKRSTD